MRQKGVFHLPACLLDTCIIFRQINTHTHTHTHTHQGRVTPAQSDTLAMVPHALVTSCSNYCNVLYLGLPLEVVWKFKLVRNAAA